MAESHVVSALRDKRGEISGEIVAAERRINDLRASLVHVDATLKLFAGRDINPEAILSRLPKAKPLLAQPMSRGDLTKAILDAVRRAGDSVTTNEVTEAVAVALDIAANDADRMRRLRERVESTLYRQRNRGILTTVKDGSRTLWRVAD
jgi:hypothetical protein